MAFRCPPELLLRNAIRIRNSVQKCNMSSNTYKAAVLTELGKPLEITKMPARDQVPSGHVRIAVKACGINFADILIWQGKYQVKPELPFIGGSELAGVVKEVGPDVQGFQPGDRVYGLTMTGSGGYAQEAILPAMAISPLPQNVSFETGAGVIISYGTAYMALTRKANIQEGETVLVTAAAGATGLATVDLAANVFNCQVIAACGSDDKCELAKKRGAAHAINYNTESIRDRVKEITEGSGADIIVDMVGGKVWDQCVRSVAFEGRLLVIGFASGEIPKVSTNLMLIKSCSIIGVYWGNYGMRSHPAFLDSIQSVSKYLSEGKVNPLSGAVFPMSKINDAFKYVMERKSTGKVIIRNQE